jgi:succinoglycan biosynthesis transport protein ExoP
LRLPKRLPNSLPVLGIARAEWPAQPQVNANVIPQEDESPGISLMQVWSILRAYRRQSIAIIVVVVLATAALAKIMPKTYAATATLMVNYETNDPLAAAGGIPMGQSYIATEMELMRTGEVLLAVIDKLNLTDDKNYIAGYNGNGSTPRDWVKNILSKDIEVEQGRAGSQLIFVTASARNPVLAASIANSLADVYLEQQQQRVSGPASARAKNYARDLGELKQKVSLAQDQVTAFRQRSGITDAPEQANNVESDLLTSLEQRYQEAQNQRRAAEVAAAGDRATSAAVAGSNVVQGLKAQISDQERQLAQMRPTLGPANPKVIALVNQIAATRKSLSAEIATFSNNAAADLTAARQLEQKLAAAVAEQRAKVLAVRKLQDEGRKYTLELESAQSVYKRALDGYDQIMFASGGHNTNVNFISRAVPAMRATKPNKPKLVLMGAVAGLFLGLAAPFGYSFLLDRRVRCRDDFERGFGVPVLSEFDAIEPTPSSA